MPGPSFESLQQDIPALECCLAAAAGRLHILCAAVARQRPSAQEPRLVYHPDALQRRRAITVRGWLRERFSPLHDTAYPRQRLRIGVLMPWRQPASAFSTSEKGRTSP